MYVYDDDVKVEPGDNIHVQADDQGYTYINTRDEVFHSRTTLCLDDKELDDLIASLQRARRALRKHACQVAKAEEV